MTTFKELTPTLFMSNVDGVRSFICFKKGLLEETAREILNADTTAKMYGMVSVKDDPNVKFSVGSHLYVPNEKKLDVVVKTYDKRLLCSGGVFRSKDSVFKLVQVTIPARKDVEVRKKLRAKDVLILKERHEVEFGPFDRKRGGRDVIFLCEVSFVVIKDGKHVVFNPNALFGISSRQTSYDQLGRYKEFLPNGVLPHDIDIFCKKGKGEALVMALNK